MTNVKDLLTSELSETKENRKNEIMKARKQGMIIMFSSFALIILFASVREFYPLPKAIALIALLFMVGGAFRMAMAPLFSTGSSTKESSEQPETDLGTNRLTGGQVSVKSLPEAEYHPPLDLETRTFDTNELAAPPSVTEHTTKHLKKKLSQE